MKRFVYILVFILCQDSGVFAFGPLSENGVSFSIGPGGGYSPKYMGSKESSPEFLPYFDLSYTHNWIKPFVSVADGAGVKVFGAESGLFSSCGVDFGESRKRSDNAKLEGTATVSSPVKYFAKAGIETEPFDFIVSISYSPAMAKYEENSRNESYDAFLYSLRMITGYPLLENLIFQEEIGMSLMNGDFAEAYHSVKYETGYYTEYNADAGLHDVYSETTIVFMPLDSFSLIFQGRYERLLGDAGRSPLTEKKNQFSGKLFVTYIFFNGTKTKKY